MPERTFGTDTSEYQAPGTYDPGAFELINAEDPTMPVKVARNRDERRPWGLYVWVYPDDDASTLVARAEAAIASAGGVPPLGVWWDDETEGDDPGTLVAAGNLLDAHGIGNGDYGSADTLSAPELAGRRAWVAQYPGDNDGDYPGDDQLEFGRPATIWQYSSTRGALDRDAIMDDAWYQDATNGGDDVLNDDDRAWIQEQLAITAQQAVSSTLKVLTGYTWPTDEVGLLAQWEQDTRAEIIAALSK